ncbi:class I SAM-dependent methyltransferase [Halorubrum vacuolatum]|uniref:Methyltransferase domain-containing protein n=1 Tax=Halorubrum vacuolatum TaxID=63740 RepID=A0A238XY25_HALVU|nr:class I SAM-dependent methyltransferase [Halorubrum vacuolatum]SNR63817.1 Methyltransferase domain-containing protein [Halorubrum vacuolatum]
MGFHTFDPERADRLEDPERYRFCSREELLGSLGPEAGETVADLGSGTGFFTDEVAPYVETLYAVDLQAEMHDIYREKGVPESVEFVTSDIADLPFADDELDAAFSTMTYHEFATPESLAEVERVIRPGGTFVVIDWSADGEGESGPPREERYGIDDAVTGFEDAGIGVVRAEDRPETFLVVGRPGR